MTHLNRLVVGALVLIIYQCLTHSEYVVLPTKIGEKTLLITVIRNNTLYALYNHLVVVFVNDSILFSVIGFRLLIKINFYATFQ